MSQFQPPSQWQPPPQDTQYPQWGAPSQPAPPQPYYPQQPPNWQPPYYPPPQGYIPGPASPYPRPVRQGVKITALSVFGVGMLLAYTGGLYGVQLAGVCGLITFILIFFI